MKLPARQDLLPLQPDVLVRVPSFIVQRERRLADGRPAQSSGVRKSVVAWVAERAYGETDW